MTTSLAYADCAAATIINGDRPGMVISLHGLTGTRAQPLALLAGVDAQGFGVLAPDLRAHGDTPLVGPAEEFTPGRLAEDVTQLIRRRGLESRRFCVLGISLGATVALELQRAGSLDVVGSIFVRPAHSSEAPVHLQVNVLIAAYLRDDPSTALERLLSSDQYRQVEAVSPSGAASLRNKVTSPGSAERLMRLEVGSRWTAFARAEQLQTTVPSLVIATRADPLHPLTVAQEWHARISTSSLVLIPSRDDDPEGSVAAARSAIQAFLTERCTGQAGPA